MQHQKLLIITIAGCLSVSGCMEEMKKQSETMFTALGGAVGGIVGSDLAAKVDPRLAGIGGLVGGLAGGILGKQLGKYLVKEDYENIDDIINDEQPQTQQWCSGTRGFGVKPTDCGDKPQVTTTTTDIVMVGKKQCRSYQTEVKTVDGKLEAAEEMVCRIPPNKEWKPTGQTTAYHQNTGDEIYETNKSV